MAHRRDFEWVVETVDTDGEIIEVSHFDTFAEALAWQPPLGSGDTLHCGLLLHYVWFVKGEDLADEEGRAYAYIGDDGQLASAFDDGEPVPARFFKEIEKVRAGQTAA